MTIAQLQADLDKNPRDAAIRFRIAQLYREAALPNFANGYEALARMRRVPCHGTAARPQDEKRYYLKQGRIYGGFSSCYTVDSTPVSSYPGSAHALVEATLPDDWCAHIRVHIRDVLGDSLRDWNYESGWCGYQVRRVLEDAAASVFIKLTIARQIHLLEHATHDPRTWGVPEMSGLT